MALPWVAKIFLAICSDNVSCCGSRRKAYFIINSLVNLTSISLLIIYGIKYGKWFILFCIVVSQICMTWCDALSDALICQESRKDLKHGASNLNTVTSLAFAFGGLIACSVAGFIELYYTEKFDPNIFFGIFAFLIFVLFISTLYLNRNLEPEIVLIKREKERLREE